MAAVTETGELYSAPVSFDPCCFGVTQELDIFACTSSLTTCDFRLPFYFLDHFQRHVSQNGCG
jgi:hypothetical protein